VDKAAKKNDAMDKDQLNELSTKIIGLAIKVHKKLGPGFKEKIYEQALCKEFENNDFKFEQQIVIKVPYEGENLGNQRIDLLVENEIIIEVKAVSRIIPLFRDQLIAYLKTVDKRLGLILNFGQRRLEIKRVVNNF